MRIATGFFLILLGMVMGWWLFQEKVNVQYTASLVLSRLHLVTVLEPEVITIPGGTFQQGTTQKVGTPDEQPPHQVTIKPFALGQYEVTFEAYDRYVELTGQARPSDEGWGRGKQPVVNVLWKDAQAYAHWLSQATGKPYRLPTESEWEYAARNRGTDEQWAGTSKVEELREYAVYNQEHAAEVGSKKPNGLGLYDMSGNVEEWVEDCWHDSYHHAPKDGSAWRESDGGVCDERVVRGGSWFHEPPLLRTTNRNAIDPGDPYTYDIGFRLALDLPTSGKGKSTKTDLSTSF